VVGAEAGDMMRALVFSGAARATFVGLAIAACGGGGIQLPRGQVSDDPGELLFQGYQKPDVQCWECHDGTGGGSKWGPALGLGLAKLTDDQIKHVILDGRRKMPAFRDKLTDDEVMLVIGYVRRAFGPPA
jgi:mono/diheme cytochrome c family protein